VGFQNLKARSNKEKREKNKEDRIEKKIFVHSWLNIETRKKNKEKKYIRVSILKSKI
jgi:hypothetical protein